MILEYYREDHIKSYWILQYPRESYKIVQDPMGWVWDLRKASNDCTAFCKILNKCNHTRSYKILQYPRQNPIKSLLTFFNIKQA